MTRALTAVAALLTLLACGGSKSGMQTAPAPAGSTAAAARTTPAIVFEAKRIPEVSDAYDVFMTQNGRSMQIGQQTLTVGKDGGNFRMNGMVSAPAMGLSGTYTHAISATTLSGVAYMASQQFQGMNFDAMLTVSNGRVTGSTEVPGSSGTKTLKVDSPTGAFLMLEEDVLLVLLPSVDLATGMEGDFQILSHESGLIKTARITVGKVESVRVPAGAFDAFRVKVQKTGDKPDTYWVSVAAPRRVVKYVQAGESIEMRLAK
jgi:hypothetical protein